MTVTTNDASTKTAYHVAPQLATDGTGNWVAVWGSAGSLGGSIGLDFDILVSRSTDNGASWTAPTPLNTNAATDSWRHDERPQVATDRKGNWVAIWSSKDPNGGAYGTDFDIFVSRSTNNGAIWTPPAALNTNAATDSRDDLDPQFATDRGGNWVAMWRRWWQISGDTFDAIFFSRSTNNAVTWSTPAPFSSNDPTDSGHDDFPQVTTDGAGTWVAVWSSSDILVNTFGADHDIFVSRSPDNGATWTDPAPLNANAATDSADDDDYDPQVTTDSTGNWVAVWVSDTTIGSTVDIYVSRSTDNGATWTAPAVLNSNAATDVWESDCQPHVTTDGAGTWVAMWVRGDCGNSSSADDHIFVSRSTDIGLTWTDPAQLNTNALPGWPDFYYGEYAPQLETDGAGAWIAIWWSYHAVHAWDGIPADYAIQTARSVAPSVTSVVRSGASPTNEPSVDFIVSFDTGVTGVDASDFLLTASGGISGASISAVSSDSGTSRTVTVSTGTGDGAIRLDVVDDDSILDDELGVPLGGTGAWNGDFDSGESYTIDKMGPTVALSSAAPEPVKSAIVVNVLLSEASIDFGVDDITPANATITELTGNGVAYTFMLTPMAQGPFSAVVNAGTCSDALGNPNTASNSVSRTYNSDGVTTSTVTGVIAGVFDASPGSPELRPIGNAVVRIESEKVGLERITAGDLNGWYHFQSLPIGTYHVTAIAPGFAARNLTLTIDASQDVVTQHFVLDPVDQVSGVEGVVTDASTNHRIIGVRVHAFVGGALEPAQITYTGGDGSYAIYGLASKATQVRLVFETLNYDTAEITVQLEPGGAPADGSATMAKSLSASGTLEGIVDSKGKGPLNLARVTVIGPVHLSTQTTDSGAYYFDELPPGAYFIEFTKAEYEAIRYAIDVEAVGTTQSSVSLVPSSAQTLPALEDVDLSGEVDAIDVQLLINAALGLLQGVAYDVDRTGGSTAVDVQLVINAALGITR